MATHLQTGRHGEALAVTYLTQKGYNLLETNWRFSRAEIDIIAKHKDILVFVEVKTRSYDYYGKPDAFVTEHKTRLMADAASVYMDRIGHDWEIRFDVVSVLLPDGQPPEINHFPDAFFPGW